MVVGASSATTTATVDIMSMLNEKHLTGTSGGSVDPHLDIPRCVDLFMGGRLPLDELVTSSYTLDNIAQALADLEQGRIVGRGVIVQK